MRELVEHTEGINRLMARYGVKFGIYRGGEFHEQLFPFDAIPRVITRQEFEYLEKGLVQRVDALNLFLNDIYGQKKIIKDGVIPEEKVDHLYWLGRCTERVYTTLRMFFIL